MRFASGMPSRKLSPARSRATRANSLQLLSPSSAPSFSVAAIQAQRSAQNVRLAGSSCVENASIRRLRVLRGRNRSSTAPARLKPGDDRLVVLLPLGRCPVRTLCGCRTRPLGRELGQERLNHRQGGNAFRVERYQPERLSPQVAGARQAPPMNFRSLFPWAKLYSPIRSFSTIRSMYRVARGAEFWSSQGAGRPDRCVRR
jgi:hypothetical protein